MGKIVTIASQKGGTAKTTTALNLSYSLSCLGDRVLLLDADPQGGMTIATTIKGKTPAGLIDYLAGRCQLKEVAFYTKEKKMAIMGIGTVDPDSVRQLEDWARKAVIAKALKRFSKHFDYIVIDAPTGFGSVPVALLEASQGVILTSQCQSLSLKSLPKMLGVIDWVQKSSNPDLSLEGIVLTMRHPDNETENEMFQEIHSGFPAGLFFSEYIVSDPVFELASLRSVPVGMLSAGKVAAHNYHQLATEYKERELLRSLSKGADDGADSGLF
ncbi:chromosome partitioning protein [Desulfuromusa kysingii]|uniref:Chromosome partitioning protein n=1 Tax=Desulfuromusa kysingii TaxID=37625 RepID=A0A1H4C9G5_9BACT|nr:ParA family protein [Desulfuromusa kysingii]SEA57051.1 chromosome partitioning protein [Desulfuromusa kysingii]